MSDEHKTRSLPSGFRLHEYELIRELGSGGFGITYLAEDQNLKRKVVIKENIPLFAFRDTESSTVHPNSRSGEDTGLFAWSLESFILEAQTIARFQHPSIVQIHRVFEANSTAYFVMPFVDGVPFSEVIQRRAKSREAFSESELLIFTLPLLDALAHLHSEKVFHRDIKPANILIPLKSDVILIDFGAARQKISEKSQTVVESPGYTPFEQLESRGNVGPWSDIYSLAATLYRAITFETPPKAADRIRRDAVKMLADDPAIASRYSHGFLTSIDRALRPFEEDRPQSVEDWRSELTQSNGRNESAQSTPPTIVTRPTSDIDSSSPAITEPGNAFARVRLGSLFENGISEIPLESRVTELPELPELYEITERANQRSAIGGNFGETDQEIEPNSRILLAGNDREGGEHRIEFALSDLILCPDGLTIGRSSTEANLILLNTSVSRRHAQLRFDRATSLLSVTDLDSGNGTWVNGQRISGTVSLSPGQLLELGEVALRLSGVVDSDAVKSSGGGQEVGGVVPSEYRTTDTQDREGLRPIQQGHLLVRLTLMFGIAAAIFVPACLSGRYVVFTLLPLDDGLLLLAFWFIHCLVMYRVWPLPEDQVGRLRPSALKAVLWTLIPGWNLYWLFPFYSRPFRLLIDKNAIEGAPHEPTSLDSLRIMAPISILAAVLSFAWGHLHWADPFSTPPTFYNGIVIVQSLLSLVATTLLWQYSQKIVAIRNQGCVEEDSTQRHSPSLLLFPLAGIGIVLLMVIAGEYDFSFDYRSTTFDFAFIYAAYLFPCFVATFGVKSDGKKERFISSLISIILLSTAASFMASCVEGNNGPSSFFQICSLMVSWLVLPFMIWSRKPTSAMYVGLSTVIATVMILAATRG